VLELCGSFSLDHGYLNHGLVCLSTVGLHLHQVLVRHLLSMKFATTTTEKVICSGLKLPSITVSEPV
jgi:hypothetical protein